MRIEEIENQTIAPEAPVPQKPTPEYLQELLKDKRQLQNLPNAFKHVEKVLEREITRVREKLFHINGQSKKEEPDLPEATGSMVTLQEKVFVPIKENPTYNFVGRLLGPRGLTAKQLEQDLECKIMVRGNGSMRDKKKEDQNRGKPNWEHLSEELHVLISVEDFQNRAEIKLKRAIDTIKSFLEQGVKTPEGEDEIKKRQLMELAIINGTYRDTSRKSDAPVVVTSQELSPTSTVIRHKEKQAQQAQVQAHQAALLSQPSLAAALGQANSLAMNPLLRMTAPTTPAVSAALMFTQSSPAVAHRLAAQPQAQTMLSPTGGGATDPATAALFYQMAANSQYYYPLTADSANLFTDYTSALDPTGPLKVRQSAAAAQALRTHPYQRGL